MLTKWVNIFLDLLRNNNISCTVLNQVNGWIETAVISGNSCYTKSVTFDASRSLYFQGVAPDKLQKSGDLVVICGGYGDQLKDLFLIPWKVFFRTISSGKPINTYRLPKVYYQYKFKIKLVNKRWYMIVQGSNLADLDITTWQYSPSLAIEMFKR